MVVEESQTLKLLVNSVVLISLDFLLFISVVPVEPSCSTKCRFMKVDDVPGIS